jgi:hypothetical protein
MARFASIRPADSAKAVGESVTMAADAAASTKPGFMESSLSWMCALSKSAQTEVLHPQNKVLQFLKPRRGQCTASDIISGRDCGKRLHEL